MMAVHKLSASYGKRRVLHDVSLVCEPGRVMGLVGPNGSGKSTLVKAIAGLLPVKGRIEFDDSTLRPGTVGYMPQDLQAPMALTVLEVVLLGRLRQLGLRIAPQDLDAVQRLLAVLNIADLAGRYLSELSGGQRQMAFLAQALVAEPKVLLLDEPISALDIRHQLEVLQVVRTLTLERKLVTLMVLHDLNAAARFADDVAILREGRVLAQGTPTHVLTVENVGIGFGVQTEALFCGDGVGVLVAKKAIQK